MHCIAINQNLIIVEISFAVFQYQIIRSRAIHEISKQIHSLINVHSIMQLDYEKYVQVILTNSDEEILFQFPKVTKFTDYLWIIPCT